VEIGVSVLGLALLCHRCFLSEESPRPILNEVGEVTSDLLEHVVPVKRHGAFGEEDVH